MGCTYSPTDYPNPEAVTSTGKGAATATYAYDNNGNVTEVGTTTFYTYDFDNRLTQSSIWNGTGTTTTTYAYVHSATASRKQHQPPRRSTRASTTQLPRPRPAPRRSPPAPITSIPAARCLARLIRKWSTAPRREPQSRGTITRTTWARRMSRQTPLETSRNGSIMPLTAASLRAKTPAPRLRRGSLSGNSRTRRASATLMPVT
jgi:hypothetical protein